MKIYFEEEPGECKNILSQETAKINNKEVHVYRMKYFPDILAREINS